MTTEEKNKIISLLQQKAAHFRCQVCGSENFTVAPDFSVFQLQNDLHQFVLGNNNIMPCIAVVCNKCGCTNFFNLIQLGYLNKEDTNTMEDTNSKTQYEEGV